MRYTLGRQELVHPFDELFVLDADIDCGPLSYEFVYEDGSPIDELLFSAPKTD